jgi:hypothetical protein
MLPLRSAFAAVLAVCTMAIVTATPAAAQNPDQSFAYRQARFRNACPPPLKFAAGACVRSCPAGYRYNGSYCRLRGGGW